MITWALVAAVVVTALLYSRWRLSYWSSRGVETAPGARPFVGHMFKFLSKKQHRWIITDEIYRKHGGSRFCGVYMNLKPELLIGDPELVKAILIKDFDHFADRRNMKLTNDKDKVFNEMLTNATGNHWKGIRSVLSTSFTSGRMKGMFPLVETKADALVEYLHKQLEKDPVVLMSKSYGLYTMEVISSCAFGLETDAFANEDSVFFQKARGLFKMKFSRIIVLVLIMMVPKLALWFKIRLGHENTDYFVSIVRQIMKQRQEGGARGDFLDIMLETREEQEEGSDKRRPKVALSDDAIVASAILFILAGFDNTANTLAFTTFLLAKNPEAQARLREELRDLIAQHGTLTYQGLMEAKFLDACISEALRLYPPGHITERKCTKDYKLPGTDVVVPEGMVVGVPIWSLHYDERYWSEPKKFDPTRFLPENKDRIVSGTYLPFGLGPRNCIAMRFAQMESKMALAKLVVSFELRCAPGHEEVKLSKTPGVMRPDDSVPMVLTPIAKE